MTTQEKRKGIKKSLRKANRDRERQAELIYAVRRGDLSIEEAINDPRAARIKVGHFFKQVPTRKPTRMRTADRLPRPVLCAMFNHRIDPDGRIGEVSEARRQALVAAAKRAQISTKIPS